MRFTVPIIDKRYVLVKAVPFFLMQRKGKQTCTIKYTGPKNAVISTDGKCVYGLNLPYPAMSHKSIITPGNSCLPRESWGEGATQFTTDYCQITQKNDEENFLQVKPHNGQYFIYCPESTITMQGGSKKCPDHIFSIPISSNFSINNATFSGSHIGINYQEQMDPIYTFLTNWHLQPSVNWTALKIGDMFSIPTPTVQPSMEMFSDWSFERIILIIVVMILVSFIFGYSRCPRRIYQHRRNDQPEQLTTMDDVELEDLNR